MAVSDGALVIDPVPFVDANGAVRAGVLISDLDLSGDRTSKPGSHVAYFADGTPHDTSGRVLDAIIINSSPVRKGGHITSHTLSSKPGGAGYTDYYVKMSTYASIISGQAEAVDSAATAKSFPVVLDQDGQSPFVYVDTASSRAGVDTTPFEGMSIGIVGLGGNGAYVLDLVAKTPVAHIHLFDGDALLQHNAFRAPGAVGLDELTAAQNKAQHWSAVYSKIHRGIEAHPYRIDAENVDELHGLDFVFVCVDDNEIRHLIASALANTVSFADTGLGLFRVNSRQLGGTVRTTLVTADKLDHVERRLPRGMPDQDAEYASNIQIADLNALNATLAVIKWKKLVGLYVDQEDEHHSCYVVSGNHLLSEEQR